MHLLKAVSPLMDLELIQLDKEFQGLTCAKVALFQLNSYVAKQFGMIENYFETFRQENSFLELLLD